MTETDLLAINIVIGDRTYRIKIYQKDEEIVRSTLKTINDKIIEFKTQFAGKDMQDYVAMVLIWYATQPKTENNENAQTKTLDILQKMELQLDKVLN